MLVLGTNLVGRLGAGKAATGRVDDATIIISSVITNTKHCYRCYHYHHDEYVHY